MLDMLGQLLIPTLIVIFGFVSSKGKVTPKEAAVQFAIQTPLIALGLWIATWNQSADTEIWNGRVAKKWHDDWVSCCHDYEECDTCTDKDGRTYDCDCVTKYRHSHDEEWLAVSTNGETVYSNTCNSPGTSTPARWSRIVVGEPTAVEHGFANYIKGNPGSVLRMEGLAAKYKASIPAYPRVFDLYRADRLLTVGVSVPNARALNARLTEINADLGARKEVNVTMLIVKEADRAYVDGLREAWLGGKKNDIVIVVGTPRYPAIAWAGVMSWSDNEEMKIVLRNRIQDLRTFDGDRVLDIIGEEIARKFVRKPWKDFDYLKATVQVPEWAQWSLFVFGLLLGIGLQIYFWRNDPFNGGRGRFDRMF